MTGMEEKLRWIFAKIKKMIHYFTELIVGGGSEGYGLADDTVCFEVLDEGDEVAVACDEYHDIDTWGDGHGVDGHPDIPVGFFLAAREFLDVFDFEFDTVGSERLKEGGFFTGFGFGDVGDGANEFAVADGCLNEGGEVYPRAIQMLGRVVHVLRIDKDGDTLRRALDHKKKGIGRLRLSDGSCRCGTFPCSTVLGRRSITFLLRVERDPPPRHPSDVL